MRNLFYFLIVMGLLTVPSIANASDLDCQRTVFENDAAQALTDVKDASFGVTPGIAQPTDVYCVVGKNGIKRLTEKGQLFGQLPYRFEYAYFTTAAFGAEAEREFSDNIEDLSIQCSKALVRCTIFPVAETQAFHFEVSMKDGRIETIMVLDTQQLMYDKGMTYESPDEADKSLPLVFRTLNDGKSFPIAWPGQAGGDMEGLVDTLAHGTQTRWAGRGPSQILAVIKSKTPFQLAFKSVGGDTYMIQTDVAHALATLEVAMTWLKMMAENP